jgi:type VI secretion system secreted protein Hcp
VDEIIRADYFLKIDGIDGESQDSKHKDEIQIKDFRMNVVNRGRQGDYKVGKAIFDDATFFSWVDQAYPKLQQACATGEKLPKAVLTCRKAGKNQMDYVRVTLSDLLITSCKLDLEDGPTPIVEFTIGFAKKQIEYKEQNADGTLGGAMTAMADLHGKRSGAA